MKLRMPQPPQVPAIDDIMPTKNARNMALFFTFLGAASYMHGSAPEIPDPSHVINAENVAALRDVFLKMGLAGGVLKTMKEAAAKTVGDNSTSSTRPNNVQESSRSTEPRPPRPSSIGSLEDLTQMLPTTITSRLYNAFSPSSSLPNVSSLNQDPVHNDEAENSDPPYRPHRNQRSHSTSHLPDTVNSNVDGPSSPFAQSLNIHEEGDAHSQGVNSLLTPETISKAMKNPTSSNPYDHPSITINANLDIQPTKLFSFNAIHTNSDGTPHADNPNSEVPSGCVGGK